jgi:Domain of unknown function (DUF6438)
MTAVTGGVVAAILTVAAKPVGRLGPPPISEIRLERTECYGTCPVYTVSLHSDGSATFIGGANAQLKGRWTGVVPGRDFQELARLADLIGFESFEAHYARPVTDNPTAIVTVARGEKRKTVSNYAESGPLALAGFEQAIDIVAARAEWSEVKSGAR